MKYLSSSSNSKNNKELYKVDKIITRKIVKRKKFYLIKWEGYSIRYCSWEPISHLYNILDMVEDFESNYPNSIDKKELKHFLDEYKLYQIKKKFIKKKVIKNNKLKSNDPIDIIINLQETDNNPNYEDKQNLYEIPIEEKDKDNESKSKDESSNNSDNKYNNLNNYGKLIHPIIIW